MINNNYENLVREVREKNYITIEGNKMLFSYDNVKKLKEAGFEINEEIIGRLMDEFHDEKFEEAALESLNSGMVHKAVSKLAPFLIQALILISLMALLYFLIPSFDNKSQTRDEDALYQDSYR